MTLAVTSRVPQAAFLVVTQRVRDAMEHGDGNFPPCCALLTCRPRKGPQCSTHFEPSTSPTIDNPRLIVHSQQPYNAEPLTYQLRASFVTPQHGFFVRSHGDIPVLDPATHRLRVGGRVGTPLDLSLDELRDRFPSRTVMATMQCAGNRRADMQRVRPTSGDPWAPGAIGNAEWTGRSPGRGAARRWGRRRCRPPRRLRLRRRMQHRRQDVPLRRLDPDHEGAQTRSAAGLRVERRESRGGAWRAAARGGPGYAGVRSPKWLHTITVQDTPSDSPIQAEDYKLFPSYVTQETADQRKA